MSKSTLTLVEVARITGLNETVITTWIENEWVTPPRPKELDHEDVARLRLIDDLQRGLGVNEEAVPVILHLLDQLFYLRAKLRGASRG